MDTPPHRRQIDTHIFLWLFSYAGTSHQHPPLPEVQNPLRRISQRIVFISFCSVGSRISPGLRRQPWWRPTYDFAKFSHKTAWNLKNLDPRASLAPPLDPPLFWLIIWIAGYTPECGYREACLFGLVQVSGGGPSWNQFKFPKMNSSRMFAWATGAWWEMWQIWDRLPKRLTSVSVSVSVP